jgi:hypothetical protein
MARTFELAFVSGGIGIFIMVACAAGVYMLARWASTLGDQDSSAITPENPVALRSHSPAFLRRDPQEVAASFPAEPSLGRIRMTKFFFKKLDTIPGPADPSVFADELWVELYDPDSGHEWWQSYFVASPQGLAQILREKSWKYLYAPEMLVVPRYDLEEIRRAVVSRIIESNELFKPKDSEEETL